MSGTINNNAGQIWAAAQAAQTGPSSSDGVGGTPPLFSPPNTSASGGYLVPTQSSTVEDQALIRVIQQAVSGVSGIAPQFVRPRFQQTPPPQPPRSQNWASVGISDRDNLDYSFIYHDSDANNGLGGDILIYQEALRFLIMFYGPNADGYATFMRDGFAMPQNWEVLNSYGLRFYGVKHQANITELINRQYIGRSDVLLSTAREVRRLYPVFNIVQGAATVNNYVDNAAVPVLTPQASEIIISGPIQPIPLGD